MRHLQCVSETVGAWVAIAVLVTSALAGAGCETVEPWQRGKLAHDCMQLPVDEAESAYRSHIEIVREGSSGGGASGGGGCGCN